MLAQRGLGGDSLAPREHALGEAGTVPKRFALHLTALAIGTDILAFKSESATTHLCNAGVGGELSPVPAVSSRAAVRPQPVTGRAPTLTPPPARVAAVC